jgi:hypothetical protein
MFWLYMYQQHDRNTPGHNEWRPKQPGQRGLRILSFDGGGTRGVLSVALLKQVMERVGKDVFETFDVVCGTRCVMRWGLGVGLGHLFWGWRGLGWVDVDCINTVDTRALTHPSYTSTQLTPCHQTAPAASSPCSWGSRRRRWRRPR